ncbi:MAG: efflux RND transporter periplasmic adaptor subunit [Bryobacteraceae bacterium]
MTSRRVFFSLLIAIAVALVVVIGLGFVPRWSKRKEVLASEREGVALPIVTTVIAKPISGAATVDLPCDLQALIESPIYARTEGYMRSRNTDIGMKVNKGDVLAELDTPELDQQIAQARATLAQARAALKQSQANLMQSKANLRLAKVTLDRSLSLVKEGVLARQDADDKQANYDVRAADVAAVEAAIAASQESVSANESSVKRVEEMKSFAKLTAPFSGIITYRNPDVGTLITTGSAGKTGEVFRVAQIDILRIFVNVPQAYIPFIKAGQKVEFAVSELPGKVFPAVVSRSTNSLDTASRSMLYVMQIDNKEGLLKPGMYGHLTIHLLGHASVIGIPGDALIMRTDGPSVAVVGPGTRVHFRKITIVRDNGTQVEVSDGIYDGDQLILSPTDAIREGVEVEPRAQKPKS